ncbi:MAG: lipid kinase YegS [Phycisphaerales bacterium]|jgi:lipid kinase YegS
MSSHDLKSIRAIVNGKNAEDPGLREAVTWARQHDHRVELHVTERQGDAARFISERSDAIGEVLIAAGGDGTINEVLNAMLAANISPEPALAVIPLGTANDFASSCGIPLDHPALALELAWKGAPRMIDVGHVNDRFFINVATGGFGADVTAKTPAAAKKVLGGLAYAVTGLLKALAITPYPARLTLPDERWEGNLIVVTVGNGRQAGGGIPVAPKAALDDGLLDLMVIHDAGLLQSGRVLSELRDVEAQDNEYLFYRQVPSLTLELDQTMRLDVDGEPIENRRFRFDILPRRLKVMLPPGTSLSWQ